MIIVLPVPDGVLQGLAVRELGSRFPALMDGRCQTSEQIVSRPFCGNMEAGRGWLNSAGRDAHPDSACRRVSSPSIAYGSITWALGELGVQLV